MRWILVWAVAGCTEARGGEPAFDAGHDPGVTEEDDAGSRRHDAGPAEDDPDPPVLEGFPVADPSPPPIAGGSLAIEGDLAVVGDPDLDRVFIASLERGVVLHDIALEPDDEPGRVAIDDRGRAHVALRRGGAVVSIDLTSGALYARRPVCANPRGIAWRDRDDTLVIACAEGLVVFLPEVGPMRAVYVDDDLRDVVITPEGMLVSRFRSAEVLSLEDEGTVIERAPPPATTTPAGSGSVAWRLLPRGEGAWLLFRLVSNSPLIGPEYYGGPGGCSVTLLTSALLPLDSHGRPAGTAVLLGGGLVVDIAADEAAESFAIASPGSPAEDAFVLRGLDFSGPTQPCPRYRESVHYIPGRTGMAVAMARAEHYGFVGYARAPSRLVYDGRAGRLPREILLDPQIRENEGHTLFHRHAGAPVACASCHPEGGDDGHTWVFETIGARRTQSMRGGISATAPFHWSGDVPTLDVLFDEVFRRRMLGPRLESQKLAAFAQWVDTIPALPEPALDPASVSRGRALFESREVGCTMCHTGPALTNSLTLDVGTGAYFQVPSLLNVGYRAPYMHDGCAPTLRDRLTDPACGGGDRHGRTGHLGDAELDDLVTYLRSL
jgi:hypothetical protein